MELRRPVRPLLVVLFALSLVAAFALDMAWLPAWAAIPLFMILGGYFGKRLFVRTAQPTNRE